MAYIKEVRGHTPRVGEGTFVAETAVLIGDVIVGPGCYVGPCASLRGDFGRLILEEGANVQDTCVMHGFPGTDTVVEQDGHIVRETDPKDRRKTLVRITPAGERARKANEQAMNDYFARIMARLTPEQLAQANA